MDNNYEGKTYTITFTQGDIRRALHNYVDGVVYEDGDRYTSDQLDYIADELIGNFDDTFLLVARESASFGDIYNWGRDD